MNSNNQTKPSTKFAWPGRKAALRRLAIIALVLFPATWIVNALLVGSWNLLGDRNVESYRHLREAAVVFVGAVGVVFLVSLLPRTQRFVNWLFSWRIMRRCLIVFAWTATIIAVFYVEEDWRGHRAWSKYRDALVAQGEQLDVTAFIPKPVPDSENFAAIPEVQSWFVRYTNGGTATVSNHWDTDNFALANVDMGSSGSDQPRHLTDLVAWQMAFDSVRAGKTGDGQTFKTDKFDPESRAKAAATVLEAFKPIDGYLEVLRAASGRPESRYPVIYDLNNPWGIMLPHIKCVKDVSVRLDLRACAELALGQSDRALDDVKLILRMSDSLKSEPFLISYLVRLSTFHLATHSVWEGLVAHRWSDAQLKELQGLFARYDFLGDFKMPADTERASGILAADLLAEGKLTLNELTVDPNPSSAAAANAFGRIMPHGWYEMEKLNYCRLYSLQLDGVFDPATKRVFPAKVSSNIKALNEAFAGRNPVTTILIRHQLLSVVMLPAMGNIPKKGAFGDATADEAMLACALERYRLAHGQFPDKLDALVPEFVSTLPHDFITGESYKYQRTADNFILYSVGWNETDDGGKAAMKGNAFDFAVGDWVWEYPR